METIGFVLVPNFALMSYASATEPLRAANLIAGKELYRMVPLSPGGVPVSCSGGFSIPCADLTSEGGSCHTILVVAGGNPSDWQPVAPLAAQLRRLGRRGIRLGGISSGAYILAAAGLLDQHDFTIHWEHAVLLREDFPHLAPRPARFVIDCDRLTCAGGVAPLDMMHDLIAARMGEAFARQVSDWYLHTEIAEPADPQRGSPMERHGTWHPPLVKALAAMEAHVENPIDRQATARLAGISERHLDRLFGQHIGKGFLETYRRIRLDHARKLLEQTAMPIGEIAFASGFSSASHLARLFRARFGANPRAIRRALPARLPSGEVGSRSG